MPLTHSIVLTSFFCVCMCGFGLPLLREVEDTRCGGAGNGGVWNRFEAKRKTEFFRFLKDWGAGTEDHSKMRKGRRARSQTTKKEDTYANIKKGLHLCSNVFEVATNPNLFVHLQKCVIEATRHPQCFCSYICV